MNAARLACCYCMDGVTDTADEEVNSASGDFSSAEEGTIASLRSKDPEAISKAGK